MVLLGRGGQRSARAETEDTEDMDSLCSAWDDKPELCNDLGNMYKPEDRAAFSSESAQLEQVLMRLN